MINNKNVYFLVKEHSEECLIKNTRKNIDINNSINEYENFKIKCFQIMDESNVYDRKLFKDKMMELYNNNYNFIINNNKLNNFISQWKNKSNKFNKNSIFDNIEDKKGNLILRDYRIFYKYDKDKRKPQKYEYVIWGNNQNLIRICKSNIWFLDGTFHHPDNFQQVLILMYKDYLTGEKIPGLYILMNKINFFLYNIKRNCIE